MQRRQNQTVLVRIKDALQSETGIESRDEAEQVRLKGELQTMQTEEKNGNVKRHFYDFVEQDYLDAK